MHAKKIFPETHPQCHDDPRFHEANIVLSQKAPAYYWVQMQCEIVWTDRLPCLGATDSVYIYINPDRYFALDNASQRAYLQAHEVGHVVLRHAFRGKFYMDRGFHSTVNGQRIPYVHSVYGVKADEVINADLDAHGLERPPYGCFPGPGVDRDTSVDAIYVDAMLERMNQPQQSDDSDDSDDDWDDDDSGDAGADMSDDSEDDSDWGDDSDDDDADDADNSDAGDDAGDDTPDMEDHGGHDIHLEPQYEGDPEEQAEQADDDQREIQRKVDEALDAMENDARSDKVDDNRDKPEVSENFGGAGYRHRGAGASTTDWRAELADVVTRKGKDGDITWGRINRRRWMTTGTINPTRKGTVDRIAIIRDTSGSVDDEAYALFTVELAALIDLMQPTSGTLVLWTDDKVQRADEVFSGQELLELEAPYGGSTYMSAGLDYMEENGLDADVILCFTDGDLWMSGDWERLVANDVLVVLDRHPSGSIDADIRRAGARVIVSTDVQLAA